MDQKKGLLPIILLITFSLVLSMWVIKNVPIEPSFAEKEKQAAIDALHLDDFDLERILAEGKPVLLNVSSDNCPYCVKMEPDLKAVMEDYKDTAIVCDVNMHEQPGVTLQIPVRGTPMQVFYYADGTPYVPSDELSQKINFLRYVLTDTDTHVMTVHEGMLTASQMEMILAELGAAL